MGKPSAELFSQQAQKYLGTPYANPPKGYKCDSLVEQCLANVGVNCNWDGTNTLMRTPADVAWIGTPEECVKTFGRIPLGACPMIHSDNGGEPSKYRGDGIGNYSHIGIKCRDPEGKGAIHASATAGQVACSKFQDKTIKNGGWNRVLLLAVLDYGEAIESRLAQLHGEISPPKEELRMTATVWTENGKPANLRQRMSTSSTLMGKIPVDDEIDVIEERGDWAQVMWNGKAGYILSRFVNYAPVDIPEIDTDYTDEPISNPNTVTVDLPYDLAVELREQLIKQLGFG